MVYFLGNPREEETEREHPGTKRHGISPLIKPNFDYPKGVDPYDIFVADWERAKKLAQEGSGYFIRLFESWELARDIRDYPEEETEIEPEEDE